MVAIGRAMMARPKVILMDKPSLGLAPIMVDAIAGIITMLKEWVFRSSWSNRTRISP